MTADIADPGLAPQGRRRIDFAERAMPVLALLRERFAASRPFDGLVIAACMHVTSETAALARTLTAGGAELHLAAANPLSTADDVAAALVAEGVTVAARHGADRATYGAHLAAVLDARPSVVLDDGCDLVGLLHADRADLLPGMIGGTEETATGVLRLRQMAADGALRLPMVAVNDTATTRLVANRHGTGQSTLDAILRATNLMLAGTTVAVAGYGWCGSGVAERARGLGGNVVVTEIDSARALAAVLDGHRVLPMAEAAAVADVLVTATGNRDVVTDEHLGALRDGAVLVNAGHFDVEIDVTALTTAAVEVHRRVRPHVDEYVLPDGRRILLLADGRVANLAAAEGHPPAVMDMSFAVQALAVEWLVGERPADPRVYDVPAGLDDEVARTKLTALGIRLDTLTDAQERYLSSWRPGDPGLTR